MANLPGISLNILDGNLNLQQGSNSNTAIIVGPTLSGADNVLAFYGDQSTLLGALGGGKATELAAYTLKTAGGIVGVISTTKSIRGGVGTATKVGTGASTLTLSLAPQSSITVTCTTGGALATAAFTFALGSGTPSAPVTSAASWSSTGYLVPGTSTTIVFQAGTYISGGSADIYTISTAGVVAHPQGAGPAVPTFTSSPIDDYTPTITVVTAGALGVMQFTYSLDGTTANTSAAVTSPGGGVYAIPGTGIVLTFAGTSVLADTWTFKAAAASFSNTDLTTALNALQTTYLAQVGAASMLGICDGPASAAGWVTMAGTIETAALSLFSNGVFLRGFIGCPTVGTVIPNAGSITIDSADTDAVVITARGTMSAPHAVPCAGDELLTSPLTGLSLRRNALWPCVARACKVAASQSIAALNDGGLNGVTGLFRDENATPGFFTAGITSLRTFSGAGASGYYVTDAFTGSLSSSDYYPLTNARVIDRTSGVARAAALPYVQAKLPTTVRGSFLGVITEKKAKEIDGAVGSAVQAALVLGSPQDAVGAFATTNRTNNLLATGQLIIAVSVQPYAYAKYVVVNIGMTISAS